jgi:hypothetical protein
MPLNNDVNKVWSGWLIDDLGSRLDDFQKKLEKALEARQMPKTRVKSGTVNMWWRKDSHYVDVISELDGDVISTIHFQEYGTSLWVARAVEVGSAWNYYKRMAARAFIESIDRCIRETALTMVDLSALRDVEDFGHKK